MSYPYGEENVNPIATSGVDSPRMVAAILIGSLVFLWLVRRGFRGVGAGIPGVGSVKLGGS